MIHEPYVGLLEHLESVSVLTEILVLSVISAMSGMSVRAPPRRHEEVKRKVRHHEDRR